MGAAEALRKEIGVPLQPEDRMVLDPYLATARSSLGEITWRTTLVEGRAMTPERAIEYALDIGEPLLPPPATHRSGQNTTALTPREEEVAVQVSRGLTNRQIAPELSISEHTVATHITKILKRLGLNSAPGSPPGWSNEGCPNRTRAASQPVGPQLSADKELTG